MMERLERAVLVTQLLDDLVEQGSWCGETHVQKGTYFAQDLLVVPLEFGFLLYKHGPFSFDLRDALTELRADGLIDLQPRPYPYGPSYVTSDRGKRLRDRYRETVLRFRDALSRAAEIIGIRGVKDLEQIATALWITVRMMPTGDASQRASRLCEVKSHVPYQQALEAIKEVDRLRLK